MAALVWPHWALAILSVGGLLIASFFTGVAYHVVSPGTRWVPAFCRMGEDTCASIVFTPQARVFGLPNSVFGIAFYLAILVGSVTGWVTGPLAATYLIASAVTVGLGVYLSYALLFVIRVPCPLCFLSHAINLVIFGLLVVQAA